MANAAGFVQSSSLEASDIWLLMTACDRGGTMGESQKMCQHRGTDPSGMRLKPVRSERRDVPGLRYSGGCVASSEFRVIFDRSAAHRLRGAAACGGARGP